MNELIKELIALKSDLISSEDKKIYKRLSRINRNELDKVLSTPTIESLELGVILEPAINCHRLDQVFTYDELIQINDCIKNSKDRRVLKQLINIMATEAAVGKIVVEQVPQYILSQEARVTHSLYEMGKLQNVSILDYMDSVDEELDEEKGSMLDGFSFQKKDSSEKIEHLYKLTDDIDDFLCEEYIYPFEEVFIPTFKSAIKNEDLLTAKTAMLDNFSIKRHVNSNTDYRVRFLHQELEKLVSDDYFEDLGDRECRDNYFYFADANKALLDNYKKVITKKNEYYKGIN